MRSKAWWALLVIGLAALSSCDSTEESVHGHTPASAKLFLAGGQELTPNVQLARGAAVLVEVRFYAANGDLITGLETEHATAVTFSPSALATVVPVAGHRFHFDVTVQNAAGTGTVTLGYGHGTNTSELTFGPFPVTIP
jgi:hypothetical protein